MPYDRHGIIYKYIIPLANHADKTLFNQICSSFFGIYALLFRGESK